MAASNYQGSRSDQQSFMDISSRLGSLEASVTHGQASREMMRQELKSLRENSDKHFDRIEKALQENQASNERLFQTITDSISNLSSRVGNMESEFNRRMEKVEATSRDYQKTKTRGYGIAAGLGLGAGGASGLGFDKIVDFIRRALGG